MMKDSKQEKLLYLFILINPLFDLLSSLFTNNGYAYTPSTFLRPIIPFIFILYLFFKDKKVRKWLLFLIAIYVLYGAIHILVYKDLIMGISFGSVIHELQYILNYTYLIFTFLLYIYVFCQRNNKLRECLFYNILFYIVTIYLAIVTGTSLPSYVEGIGYKGWFNTSGAVGSILIISLFVLIPYLINKKMNLVLKIIFLLSLFFYLCFLIGSRTGLFGSILVIGTYLVSIFITSFINKKGGNIKKIFLFTTLIAVGFVLVLFSSHTLERRKQLNDLEDDYVHIAYDLIDIKNDIDNDKLKTDYMNKQQILALNSLYEHANKIKLSNIDLRTQQLLYHYYLYTYQNDVVLKLFGNGYLANFGALTLEMETIALFFNFGIVGFLLYAMPFFIVFGYAVFIGVKNFKSIDIEYIMYLIGSFVSYLISLLAGHVYFNTSVMPVIIIIHVLLLNKTLILKKGNN